MRDAAVVIDGSSIAYVGPRHTAPDVRSPVSVPCLMPGLWDCHAHFLGLRSLDLNELALVPTAVLAARAAKDAEIVLQAGFTTVREAGGLGVHLARVVEEGLLAGPSIYAPGAILSQTGGHGDLHALPLPWMGDLCQSGGPLALCDGIPECLKAVRCPTPARCEGHQDLRLRRGLVPGRRPCASTVQRRRDAGHRRGGWEGRADRHGPLPRKAGHHGGPAGRCADHRARQLPGRGSRVRHARARSRAGADPVHRGTRPSGEGQHARAMRSRRWRLWPTATSKRSISPTRPA